jgi:hypothetical protein
LELQPCFVSKFLCSKKSKLKFRFKGNVGSTKIILRKGIKLGLDSKDGTWPKFSSIFKKKTQLLTRVQFFLHPSFNWCYEKVRWSKHNMLSLGPTPNSEPYPISTFFSLSKLLSVLRETWIKQKKRSWARVWFFFPCKVSLGTERSSKRA